MIMRRIIRQIFNHRIFSYISSIACPPQWLATPAFGRDPLAKIAALSLWAWPARHNGWQRQPLGVAPPAGLEPDRPKLRIGAVARPYLLKTQSTLQISPAESRFKLTLSCSCCLQRTASLIVDQDYWCSSTGCLARPGLMFVDSSFEVVCRPDIKFTVRAQKHISVAE